MTAVATRSGGRPRSDDVTARVESAAREAFSSKGFGPVTMSEVAAAAGVGLDSIYRRWPSKQALLVDLVAHAVSADLRVPDLGSLEEDLRALMRGLVQVAAGDLGGLLAVAIGECAHDPVLAERLALAQEVRRTATLAVVDRAIARGELPSTTDGRLLLDSLGGLVWQRTWLSRVPLSDADVDDAVAGILRGCAP